MGLETPTSSWPKLRSILQQRKRVPRPRDYYDLWDVLKNKDVNRKAVRAAFLKKCELKIETFKSVDDFFGKVLLEKNATAWVASIGRRVKEVPSFDVVVEELDSHLRRLFH